MAVNNLSALLRAFQRPGTVSPPCHRTPFHLVGVRPATRASTLSSPSSHGRQTKGQARDAFRRSKQLRLVCRSTDFNVDENALSTRKKIVFMGTPEIAAGVLKTLLDESSKPDASFEVSAVVTQPGRPTGRKRIIRPSPVETMALEHGIDANCILTPTSARDEEFLATMSSLQPSLCVTAAYGNFLPKAFLAIPEFGTLNIHPSLLPKYRGAAPVQRALEAGEPVTGVTLAFTVLKMDAGPIVAQEEMHVDPDVKAPQLLEELFAIGARLLVKHLGSVWTGKAMRNAVEQNPDEVTHTEKVRGFAGWPGTEASFTTIDANGSKDDVTLKVITTRANADSPCVTAGQEEVEIRDGAMIISCGKQTTLEVLEVQPPGKKAMKVKDFQNGLKASKKKLFKSQAQ